MAHICIGHRTIIGSDNGLSPVRRQAIIWTSARILLTGPLWTNFSEILIENYLLSVKKMHLNMLSEKNGGHFVSASMCLIYYSIMMLVKFLTSANQKHRIWSRDESGLCNQRPRFLGDEVVVGPSLMFRKMILQDNTNLNQL